MKKILSFVCLFLLPLLAYCGDTEPSYAVSFIPDSLTQNAYAVIRQDDIQFDYETLEKGTFSEKIVITVLEENGKKYANFYYPGDKYRKLASFSGKIFDSSGNLIGKVKKSEVQSSAYSPYLGSDDLNYFYTCAPRSYPYTVVYEYCVDFKNGILTFPPFCPQMSGDVSLQSASYSLLVPPNTKFVQKRSFVSPCEKKISGKSEMYTWKVNNLKAIEYEPLMPDFQTFLPFVFIRPENFIYDDVSGQISDWKTFGAWDYSLLYGRQELPDEAKNKILELTAKAKSDKEKVKILYDYLGETTHYQNISLGIGGYQPMPAAEVYKVGFGDCKALSNYLCAMLQIVGIKSYLTLIQYDEDLKDIYTDFANFKQFNHVILQVPLKSEKLYLECTNTDNPFGFIHNGIAGHQALVLKENGGEMVRLPDYPDSLSVDKYVSEVKLFADGTATVKSSDILSLKEYDDFASFTKSEHSEQVDRVRGFIGLPAANITDVLYTEDKSPLPSIDLQFDWSTIRYGNKTGTRFFIPVNPMKRMNWKLKKERKSDLEVVDGDICIDSVSVTLPENLEVEALPSQVSYSCSFGSFTSKVSVLENKITVYQELRRNRGYWKKEKYAEFLTLVDKATAGYKGKIVLKSKP